MIARAAGREAWGDREPALRGGEFRGRQSVDGTRRRPTAHPDTAKVENCATCPWPSLVGGGEGRGGAHRRGPGSDGPARLLPVPLAVTRAGRGVVGQPGSAFGAARQPAHVRVEAGILRSGTTAGCRLRARKGRPRRHTEARGVCSSALVDKQARF